MTTTTNSPVTINALQAAVLSSALETAIDVTKEQMQLKGSAPYRAALRIQLAGYEAEKQRLAAAFPITDAAA